MFMIFGFIFFAIDIFVLSNKDFKSDQDKYFEKVDYYFSGQMYSYKLLGGTTYFIEIDVDSALFKKDEISIKDNFVGLYLKKHDKIFFYANFELNSRENEKILSNALPYVKVNSSTRSIEYISKQNIIKKETLIVSDIYLQDFKNMQTDEMIRF